MPTTAVVYRDGKAIRSTVLSAADADKFIILAEGVRLAQSIMRNKPEMDADGKTLKGVTRQDGVPYSERHPDDIYAVLPRLAELLGKHARAIYPHLDEVANGDVLRNADGTPQHGLKLAHKNTAIPAPFHPSAALSGQASTLGMIPLDGLAFDRCELVESGAAAITESGGAKVSVSGGVPTVRNFVRWRG